LIISARAQVAVALLQRVDEIVRRLLQIAITDLRRAEIYRITEHGLAIRRTVPTGWRKPQTVLIQFGPVSGNADRECSSVISAIARRWIIDATPRHRFGIPGAIAVWILIALIGITPSAALNLGHRLRARITTQTFLDAKELAAVRAHCGVHAQVLRFLVDARVTILGARVIA